MKKFLLFISCLLAWSAISAQATGTWEKLTKNDVLSNGDIVTLVSLPTTVNNVGDIPSLVSVSCENDIIKLNEYTLTDGIFNVEPLKITLEKNDSNWNLRVGESYIIAKSGKNNAFLDSNAQPATISIDENGLATINVSVESRALQFNHNTDKNNKDYISRSRIAFYKNTQKNCYLYRFTPAGGENPDPVDPVAPSNLTIKYGDISVSENDEVSVTEGTEFSISAKDATNITITDIDDNLLATFDSSSCKWTPEVMEENIITVTASNEVGEIFTMFSLVVSEKVLVPGEFDFINNEYGMKRLSGTTNDYNPDPFTFGDDVATITLNGSTRLWADGIRFYKGSKFSVKAAKGYYITDINFEGGLTNNVTVDGVKNDGSWTGASGEVEFVSTHESGNKAMSTLTVKVAELPEGVHNFTVADIDIDNSFSISKDAESADITITGVHAESELYYKFTETPAVNPEAAPRKVVDHTGYTKVEPNGDGTHTVTVSEPGTLELYAYHPATDSKSEIKTIAVTKASDTTAIDEIGADVVEGEAEYFNLQGVKINPENATPGLYIRRQGGKVAKVMVK